MAIGSTEDTMEEARSTVLSTTELAAISASEADVGTNPSTTLLAAAGRSVARGISVVTPSIMLLTNSEGWERSLGRASLRILLAAAGTLGMPSTVLEVTAGRSEFATLETIPEISSTRALVGES